MPSWSWYKFKGTETLGKEILKIQLLVQEAFRKIFPKVSDGAPVNCVNIPTTTGVEYIKTT
jgi:hypothetical protein